MADITQILRTVDAGDELAASQLLSIVYDELKQLAAARLTSEAAGHSLQTTDLVHEAYLRLFNDQTPSFQNRAHFFAAASEAMRRVLIDRARRRLSKKRGPGIRRVDIDPDMIEAAMHDETLLRLEDALDRLERQDPDKAKLVKLRFFAGFPIREAAQMLGISTATADRQWRFAKAWLKREMASSDSE